MGDELNGARDAACEDGADADGDEQCSDGNLPATLETTRLLPRWRYAPVFEGLHNMQTCTRPHPIEGSRVALAPELAISYRSADGCRLRFLRSSVNTTGR